MLKFLRKYKTWILVVGGTLLMIAFLLPGNINSLPQMSGSGTFMSVDGQKISMADAQKAFRDRQAVDAVAPGMTDALGVDPEIDHWILLVKAADQLGLIGGPDDGREYIPDLAVEVTTTALRHGLDRANPQDMEALERTRQSLELRLQNAGAQLRMPDREIYQALANFRGVVRMIGMYSSMGEVVSLPRVAQEARRRLDQGIVDYVFIPSTSYVHTVPEPTPEEITAHYEKYRDVEPGQGEYGLGYRFGPRFQLEWLTLSRSTLRSAVTVSPVDVRKAFMQQTPGGTEEQFQAARPEIEIALHTAEVDRLMQDAATTVRAEIAKTLRKVESSGQYRELPPDWMSQRPNLDAISAAVLGRLIESQGLRIPPPAVTRRQDTWLTQTSVGQLPGIGTATIRRGARSGSFSQYVGSLKELAGPNELGLQVGVPGDALTDRDGNMYFFTITGFKPAGPAESVDELQTLIVSTLKRIAAFEQLKANAEAYRLQAIAGGLEPLAKPLEDAPQPATALTIRRDVGVTRTDQLFMDQVLNSDAAKNAILDAVTKLDPKADPKTIDVSQRTLVLPIPERLGLAVIVVKGYNATTAEATRWRDFGLARAVGSTELREAAGADAAGAERGEDPFTLQTLAKRFNAELSVEHKSMEERRAKEEAERAAAAKPGTPAGGAKPKIEAIPVR